MNAFQIKIFAIAMMIIDHLGLFFFPHVIWLRIIGRLSFPLFAWLIANGARHTHDIKRYLLRLYFFSLIAQMPFFIANKAINPTFGELNVLCTLFLGLAAIYGIARTKNKVVWVAITVVCFLLAQFLQTDYGGVGVISIVLFYLFYNNFLELVMAQIVLFVAEFVFFQSNMYAVSSLLSLIVIRYYNGQPGLRMKYLFYLFYPLQYVIYFLLLRGWLL